MQDIKQYVVYHPQSTRISTVYIACCSQVAKRIVAMSWLINLFECKGYDYLYK
jgi:hypothetical protein